MRVDNLTLAPDRSAASRNLSRRGIMGLSLGAGVLVAGTAGAVVWIGSKEPGPPPPRPRRFAVIVDVTDIPTQNQRTALTTAYKALLGNLTVGDVLSLDLLVPSQNGPLHLVFSDTKPDPGDHANPWWQNAGLMQADAKAFVAKAEGALSAVDAVKQGSQTSPIVEALWVLAQRGPVDHINLWSDMVNCSGTINHFAKTFSKFGELTTRKLPLTGLGALGGASVTINQLALNTAYQTQRLREWWDAYWNYIGVASVSWTLVPA
jgi:hypothetical protein